jgi:hypothetical protein
MAAVITLLARFDDVSADRGAERPMVVFVKICSDAGGVPAPGTPPTKKRL